LWLLGAAAAWIHVGLAFHFRHAWSHASALLETARQTNERLGYEVGAGVYVNYAFLVVWGADALWWAFAPASYGGRPRGLDASVRAFLLFVFVNGTIVFGRRPVALVGTLSLLILAAAWYVGRAREKRDGAAAHE
jgi:hypothetical protein